MAEQGVFNPANSVPLGTPAQVASPPAVFDPSRSVPLGLPNEMIFNDQTGEVIEAPHGTTATLGEIFSRGLDKGDADTKISKLHFEQFMGNDTPAITAEIARLRKLSGPQIKTDGVLGEIFRATAQQLPVLKEIFGHAAERGAQGAIGGGMYGMAFAGVGSVPGFFAGLGAGALSGTIEGTFILETGETYAEISQFKHHDGSFVDPMAARIGAVAAGALSAGLEVMPMALLFRLVPGSKNVIGKLGDKALKALKIPTGKTAFRKFVLNISTIMAVETVTEGGQEEAKIIAGDLVKLTTDAATPLVTGNNALERVANAMEEALKATPLIATGFSTPKLGADILQQRAEAKLRPNTKEQKVEDMPNETVDSVTNKLKKAPVSADLKTYDVGELNETEMEELEAAGIEVADNGTIVAADAELIAAESQRRTDFYKKQEASQSKAANKEAEVVERQVSRARIRKIDEVVKGMDETIDATLETIDQLKAQDKPTKKLNNRVNKLLKQREILDEERASLLTTGTALGKAREALKATDKQVELKGAELIKAQRRTAKARVRAVQSSLNAALKLGRDNVKAAQSAVIDVINNSALPNDLKGKFLVAMRNVQTLEQLKKAVPRIQARIDKMVHKKRRGVVLKQLKKVIKSTKTKGTKGKFGAEVGDILNNVRKAFGLSDEAAQKILDVQSEAGTTEIPTPEQALENRILMLRADQKGTDLNQLESLLETLVALTELGKGIRKADILKKQEASAALRAELIDLMGPVRVETDAQRRRRLAAAKAEAVIFLGNSGAWWNKIKRIMRSSNKGRVDAFLEKVILFDESRNFDKGKENAVKRFTELMMAALNTTSERDLLRYMQNSETEQLNLGAHTHADGVHELLDIKTRAELRKRIMELKAPDLKISMMNEEKGNRYTPQIIEVLEGAMNETDWRMVDAQLQFYAEYFPRINEVYARVYGMSLPNLEFYSPIKREHGNEQLDEFMKGIHYRGGVAPSSLKSRKPSIRTIRAIGDMTVFQSHINEMEYFIAYAEKVQTLNHVFANPEVQDHMQRVFGEDLQKSINDDLDAFSKRGVQNSLVGEQMLQVLYRNFTFAQLGAKPQIGLKQLASFAAYMEDVKTTDFLEGLAVFARHPKRSLEVLRNSQFFADRGINIDQDYKAMTEGRSKIDIIGNNPTLAHILMLPIRWGDKGAIAIGGFAHVHAEMKRNGGDQKAALRSFDLLSVRTQQSTDIDQLSALQRTSSLIRVFTRFMSSANALTRAEYNAILDKKAGRISKKEFWKRMMVYHVFIPGLIQFIANGVTWDRDDQLRASLLGTFNGVFLFKDVADALFRWGMDTKIFDIEGGHPMGFVDDMFRSMADFAENGIPMEDIIEGTKAIDGFLDGLGALTGVPLKTISRELRGLGRLATGARGDEAVRGGAEAIGYSPYTIDEKILAE